MLPKKNKKQNSDPTLWCLESHLLDGLSVKVRANGLLSGPIPVRQGVGQGKILSPYHYKIHINPLLNNLHRSGAGASVGCTEVGFPTCADDVLEVSSTPADAQTMFGSSQMNADTDRYTIHPQKTYLISYNYKSTSEDSWSLGDNNIPLSDSLVHLGLTRVTDQLCPDKGINDHVSGARATLYSLLGAGVHGRNGLTPSVTRSIYQTYVMSRLTYGLEVLRISSKQMDTLEKFHKHNLRLLQSLPDRTAVSALYLLIGIPPLEAIIHMKIANLIGTIVNQPGSTLHELMLRQLPSRALVATPGSPMQRKRSPSMTYRTYTRFCSTLQQPNSGK
jgi:hypothetical protein